MNTERTAFLLIVALSVGCEANEESPALSDTSAATDTSADVGTPTPDVGSTESLDELLNACPVLSAIPDVDEAWAPLGEDRTAVYLTLPCSDGAFVAPAAGDLYAADLDHIRHTFPDTADHVPHDEWAMTGRQTLQLFVPEGADLQELADSPELACFADLLRADIGVGSGHVVFAAEIPFNLDVIGPLLEAIANVERVSESALSGDGGDIRLRWDYDVREFWFSEGFGDCPSGCAGHHHRVFRSFGHVLLGPEWVTGAAAYSDHPDLPSDPGDGFRLDDWGCDRVDGEAVWRWDWE